MTKPEAPNRRQILAGSVAAATAASLPESSQAKALNDDRQSLSDRRNTSRALRTIAAEEETVKPFTTHPTNDDEDTLNPRYIGNFTKGLKLDNEFGVVNSAAYEALRNALSSGDPDQLEAIELAAAPDQSNPILDALNGRSISIDVSNKVLRAPVRFYTSNEQRAEMLTQPLLSTLDRKPIPVRYSRFHAEQATNANGANKLIDPQAALAFDLEGYDSHHFAIPKPPSYASVESVGDIAENYWMARLRDEPFITFNDPGDQNAPLIDKAINHLNSLGSKFPGASGKPITRETLFRGTGPGEEIGPYISQFLLRDIPYGAYTFEQKIKNAYLPVLDAAGSELRNAFGRPLEQVFLITAPAWYQAQLGIVLPDVGYGVVQKPKHSYRPRDLCNYVHIDELFQAYLNAAIIMAVAPSIMNENTGPLLDSGGLGVELNSGNPYRTSKTQKGFGTLGEPNFASLIAEIATRALKAVWYQKWIVHRRLRPEAYAGHIHYLKTKPVGAPAYPLHKDALKLLDPVLTEINSFNKGYMPYADKLTNKPILDTTDTFFLPMAFKDGCPVHPAYGAGHATVAGACVTLLKAFYNTQQAFSELRFVDPKQNNQAVPVPIYVPDALGKRAQLAANDPGNKMGTPFSYNDLAKKMTVEGELNKLASNISLARNFAGVHWRTDHAVSLPLGEKVAIEFLKEIKPTYNENVSFNFRTFAGDPISI